MISVNLAEGLPRLMGLFWSAATVGLYLAARWVHRRTPRWWTSPLSLAQVLLIFLALALHESYADYIRGTHWLMTMLGPVTVAFALPIYQQRALIRRQWPVLLAGVLAGNAIAMLSAWGLATLLHLSGAMRLSLLPRSVSTPFAMAVSGDIGWPSYWRACSTHSPRRASQRSFALAAIISLSLVM